MREQRIVLHRQHPQLTQLGIPCFGYYNNHTPKTKIDKSHHGSCYEIHYLADGMQPFSIYDSADDEAHSTLYKMYGGDVSITRPYEYHSSGDFYQLKGRMYWFQIDSECSNLLNLKEEQSALLKEALDSLHTPLLHLPKSIAEHFIQAFELMMTTDKTKFFHACQLLSIFIIELADYNKMHSIQHEAPKNLSAQTIKALSYIQNNLTNSSLDIQNVADHLCFSRSYIMSKFHREMGITMHEYILRRKIEYACELLKDLSITETSYFLNFSSSQHFSCVFKKYMGITPHNYKKSQQ